MYVDKSGEEIVEELYAFEDKGGRGVSMTPAHADRRPDGGREGPRALEAHQVDVHPPVLALRTGPTGSVPRVLPDEHRRVRLVGARPTPRCWRWLPMRSRIWGSPMTTSSSASPTATSSVGWFGRSRPTPTRSTRRPRSARSTSARRSTTASTSAPLRCRAGPRDRPGVRRPHLGRGDRRRP